MEGALMICEACQGVQFMQQDMKSGEGRFWYFLSRPLFRFSLFGHAKFYLTTIQLRTTQLKIQIEVDHVYHVHHNPLYLISE